MPDDAEVVPPDADVATGFTPGWIARTDRTQGHNRGINPLATWKCGRRGGRPSPRGKRGQMQNIKIRYGKLLVVKLQQDRESYSRFL